MSNFSDVPFPAAGEGAFLRVTIADLEEFEKLFGDNYVQHMQNEIDKMNLSIIRQVADLIINDGSFTVASRAMPLADIARALVDALSLALHGKTLEEHKLEEVRKQIEFNRRFAGLREEAAETAKLAMKTVEATGDDADANEES